MTAVGYGSFWVRKGVMFVRSNDTTIGPSEYLPQIKARGYGWVAFDPTTGEWADERRIAEQHGLDVVAWKRLKTLTDLDTLMMASNRWGDPGERIPVIPNIEIPGPDDLPLSGTRDAELMAKTLVAMSRVGRALLISDGWADPIGCWHGYRKWVGSTECFPEDAPAFIDVNGCVTHASAFFRAVVPALGAYPFHNSDVIPVRSDYAWPLDKPWIVYPGDTVRDWSHW